MNELHLIPEEYRGNHGASKDCHCGPQVDPQEPGLIVHRKVTEATILQAHMIPDGSNHIGYMDCACGPTVLYVSGGSPIQLIQHLPFSASENQIVRGRSHAFID